jgi:hypothetical protein
MLSETDLQDGVFENISNGDMFGFYDRVILWSGTFSLDKYGEGIIKILRNSATERFDFMLTDLRLVPEDKENYKYFDTIYTQATQPLEGIGGIYGGVAEFRAFGVEFETPLPEVSKQKTLQLYFGGTERGRLDDFLEYVWRPDFYITTKSAFLGIENRVTRDEYLSLLNKTKYSICIADVEYNENHFITPRPYEYFAHDIICFTDNKFDPDAHIIPKDSWLRVNNYKEFKQKVNELENNAGLYNDLLTWQRGCITPELVNGDYVYQLIK